LSNRCVDIKNSTLVIFVGLPEILSFQDKMITLIQQLFACQVTLANSSLLDKFMKYQNKYKGSPTKIINCPKHDIKKAN